MVTSRMFIYPRITRCTLYARLYELVADSRTR